jgi:hypothetical protein
MTLSTIGYTVGSNLPLNHARILWDMITGAFDTGSGGTGRDLPLNDITSQRWTPGAGVQRWAMTTTSLEPAGLDTLVIAAHNLWGKTFRPQYRGDVRTNYAVRSEEFDNAVWTKTRTTVTANAVTAPNGTMTADTLVETAVAGTHIIRRTENVFLAVTCSFSIYVKAAGRTRGTLRIDAGSDEVIADFDLVALTTTTSVSGAGVVSGSSITALPDGWFRVSVTGIPSSGTSTYGVQVNLRNAAGAGNYTGDGVSGMHIWGAQLERNPAPTSYFQAGASTSSSAMYDLAPWMTPADNSTIAIFSNNAGVPWLATGYGIEVSEGTGVTVGIIRAGVALQMERPLYGGHAPLGWSRLTEAEPSVSEGGQWLSQIVRRMSEETTYSWQHLTQEWYRANFEPFAKTIPQRPFAIVGNPARLGEADVGWCFTRSDARPVLMGIRDLVQVDLPVTGYAG